jgi:hypothetical protein
MYIRPHEMTARIDAKLREKLKLREAAGGAVVKALVPTICLGTRYYTPTSSWLDAEVRKAYPTAVPTEPLMTDGDTVRLYFLEDE